MILYTLMSTTATKKTTLLNKNNNLSLQGQQNQLLSKSQVHSNCLCVIQQWLLYSLHKE